MIQKSMPGIQTVLRKLKNRLSTKEYHQLYPAGSCSLRFNGQDKIHKLSSKRYTDDLGSLKTNCIKYWLPK